MGCYETEHEAHMTDEQIQFAIQSGRLKLNTWDKITHYGFVVFLGTIPMVFAVIHGVNFAQGSPKALREGEIWFMVVPSILGLLFYFIQKNRLKFKVIHTELTREELEPIIEKAANELEWTPYMVNEKVIVAKTHPSFFSGSWGEQITLVFDRDRILVNSISDPDKPSAIVSMGRNKLHVKTLIDEIMNASCSTCPK